MAEAGRNPDELLAESLRRIEATIAGGEPADPDKLMRLIDAQTREVQSLIVHLMADLTTDPQPLAEVNTLVTRAVTDVLMRSPRPLLIRSRLEPALPPIAFAADALQVLFRRCLDLLRDTGDENVEIEVATAAAGLGAAVTFESNCARPVPAERLTSAREFVADLGGRLRVARGSRGFRIELEFGARAAEPR